MSNKLHPNHNFQHYNPEHDRPAYPSKLDTLDHNVEQPHNEKDRISIDNIRDKVELHSSGIDKHKYQQEAADSHHERPHHYITKEIKRGSFENTIVHTRKKLNKLDRFGSRLIHNDLIEPISEIGAKTIARPNQILAGGIVMVVLGFILLFVSRRYGFEIPLSIFLALYIVGYMLALFIGLILSTIKKILVSKKI